MDLGAYPPEKVEAVVASMLGANKGLSLGPYLLEAFLGLIQYGMGLWLFVHWWIYSKPTERLWVTILTIFVSVAATAYAAIAMYFTFYLFVSNFGRYSPFMDMQVLNQNYIIGLCTRLPVCGFFVHRAWRLWNRSYLVLCVLGTTLLASAVGLIGARVVSPSNIILATSTEAALEVKWTIIWLVPGIISEILTTAAIVVALIRSRTGWKQTDWLITNCAIGAIESQVPCTAVSLLYLIIFETHSHDNLRVSLMFAPITFALALLSTLNLRVSLQRHTSGEREWSGALTDENKFALPMSVGSASFKPRQGGLQVGTEVLPYSPRFDSA